MKRCCNAPGSRAQRAQRESGASGSQARPPPQAATSHPGGCWRRLAPRIARSAESAFLPVFWTAPDISRAIATSASPRGACVAQGGVNADERQSSAELQCSAGMPLMRACAKSYRPAAAGRSRDRAPGQQSPTSTQHQEWRPPCSSSRAARCAEMKRLESAVSSAARRRQRLQGVQQQQQQRGSSVSSVSGSPAQRVRWRALRHPFPLVAQAQAHQIVGRVLALCSPLACAQARAFQVRGGSCGGWRAARRCEPAALRVPSKKHAETSIQLSPT